MGLLSLLFGLAAAGLLSAGFYQMTRVRPDPSDLTFLQQHNLYALYVLRIVESADYQYYARKNQEYRDFLFQSYAQNLEKDIVELGEIRTGLVSTAFRWLFRATHQTLRLKRHFKSSIGDLRLLLGIVLALARHISR